MPDPETGRALTILTLLAAVTGLAALTAAAFAMSYSGIHLLAREAGVSGPLAGIYPAILDALLVVAGCAVLVLPGAGLISRLYSWVFFLVLLAGLAAGAATGQARIRVPRHAAELGAAIVPFAMILAVFGLVLVLMRHARVRRRVLRAATASIPRQVQVTQEAGAVGTDTEPESSVRRPGSGTLPRRSDMPHRPRIPRASGKTDDS